MSPCWEERRRRKAPLPSTPRMTRPRPPSCCTCARGGEGERHRARGETAYRQPLVKSGTPPSNMDPATRPPTTPLTHKRSTTRAARSPPAFLSTRKFPPPPIPPPLPRQDHDGRPPLHRRPHRCHDADACCRDLDDSTALPPRHCHRQLCGDHGRCWRRRGHSQRARLRRGISREVPRMPAMPGPMP